MVDFCFARKLTEFNICAIITIMVNLSFREFIAVSESDAGARTFVEGLFDDVRKKTLADPAESHVQTILCSLKSKFFSYLVAAHALQSDDTVTPLPDESINLQMIIEQNAAVVSIATFFEKDSEIRKKLLAIHHRLHALFPLRSHE